MASERFTDNEWTHELSAEELRILRRVSRLARLRKQANPGDASIGKTATAIEAIRVAGHLLDQLAGWAIDHMAGLSASGIRLPEGISRKIASKEDEFYSKEFSELLADSDNNRHQFIGKGFRSNISLLNRADKIKAISTVLKCRPLGDAAGLLLDELVKALEANSHGLATELLTPEKIYMREPQTTLRLEKEMCEYLLYKTLTCKGKTKGKIVDEMINEGLVPWGNKGVQDHERKFKRKSTIQFKDSLRRVSIHVEEERWLHEEICRGYKPNEEDDLLMRRYDGSSLRTATREYQLARQKNTRG